MDTYNAMDLSLPQSSSVDIFSDDELNREFGLAAHHFDPFFGELPPAVENTSPAAIVPGGHDDAFEQELNAAAAAARTALVPHHETPQPSLESWGTERTPSCSGDNNGDSEEEAISEDDGDVSYTIASEDEAQAEDDGDEAWTPSGARTQPRSQSILTVPADVAAVAAYAYKRKPHKQERSFIEKEQEYAVFIDMAMPDIRKMKKCGQISAALFDDIKKVRRRAKNRLYARDSKARTQRVGKARRARHA